MGYDLFLRPPLGTLLSSEEKREVVEALRQETAIDYLCELTVFRNGPYGGESQTLAECLEEGEFKRDELERFCTLHNLAPDHGETEADAAAQLFLSYKWGQNLVSPRMPRDDDDLRKAYRLLIDFARRHNLVVHDPQVGEDIDLNNPGEFPPMYGPTPPAPKRGWLSWIRNS